MASGPCPQSFRNPGDVQHGSICEDLRTLQVVPDWFVLPKIVEMWQDNYFDADDDHELDEWYDG